MRGDPLTHHVPIPLGSEPRHDRQARLAVGLAAGAAAAIGGAVGLFGIAYAVGGADATADGWVGVLVVLLLFGGLVASLVGCGLALEVRRRERWGPLWLPLLLFPTLIVLLVIGEAFWWE